MKAIEIYDNLLNERLTLKKPSEELKHIIACLEVYLTENVKGFKPARELPQGENLREKMIEDAKLYINQLNKNNGEKSQRKSDKH